MRCSALNCTINSGTPSTSCLWVLKKAIHRTVTYGKLGRLPTALLVPTGVSTVHHLEQMPTYSLRIVPAGRGVAGGVNGSHQRYYINS